MLVPFICNIFSNQNVHLKMQKLRGISDAIYKFLLAIQSAIIDNKLNISLTLYCAK